MEAYTIPDAARVTGLSPREIRVRIEEGRLRATWRGGRRMLDRDELERAAMLADDASPARSGEASEPIPELVERLEEQAGELAVLQRASAERRARDERERQRLQAELDEARSELQRARVRIAELEAQGFRASLRPAERPALTPLFENTRNEDPPAPDA
jgi:chromosome segregation ATPase